MVFSSLAPDGPVFRVAPAPAKGSLRGEIIQKVKVKKGRGREQSTHLLGVGGRAETIGDFGGGRDAVRGHCISARRVGAIDGGTNARRVRSRGASEVE